VARLVSTSFVVLLLAATAAAFALSEGAKSEPSPIYRPHASGVFSPDCRCARNAGTVSFRLRTADRLTLWLERDGERVATVVSGRRYPSGPVAITVDGITSSGTVLGDGAYAPVVHLEREHRTIRLPSRLVVDSKAPAIRVPTVPRAIISPDGDHRHDTFAVRYSVSEPARPILLVDDRRVAVAALAGRLVWNGRLGGRAVPRGLYVLKASAEDRAGNRAPERVFAIVQVRYVALGRDRILARPGGRFAVRVSTDSPTVRWTLHGRSGVGRRGTLRLRAPRRPGVYHLFVSANGHAAKAAVVVA
jgi:hypothetical protein